jgi:hypothetical protein
LSSKFSGEVFLAIFNLGISFFIIKCNKYYFLINIITFLARWTTLLLLFLLNIYKVNNSFYIASCLFIIIMVYVANGIYLKNRWNVVK